jgi:hypothetical protein
VRPEQAHAGVAEGATEDIADLVRVRRSGDREPAERATYENGPHRAPHKADRHQPESSGRGQPQVTIGAGAGDPVGAAEVFGRGQPERGHGGHRDRGSYRPGERRTAQQPHDDQHCQRDLRCGRRTWRPAGQPAARTWVGVHEQQVVRAVEAARSPGIENQRRDQAGQAQRDGVRACGCRAVERPGGATAGMQQRGVPGGDRRHARADQGEGEQRRTIRRLRQRMQTQPSCRDE